MEKHREDKNQGREKSRKAMEISGDKRRKKRRNED